MRWWIVVIAACGSPRSAPAPAPAPAPVPDVAPVATHAPPPEPPPPSPPAPATAEAATARAKQHFVDGSRAFKDSDFTTAVREFEAAFGLEPLPELLYNIGQTYYAMGDYARAATAFARALADPALPKHLRELVEARMRQLQGQP